MTKPTGRPQGRPKTTEYTTLMARVPQELADRVKRYAAAHRQPLSVVMRDALLLLMDEYPSSADLSAPHRIAAHEFLSDRYDSSLDTLLGETDSAEFEALLSDTNEEVVDAILEGVNRRPDMVSDTHVPAFDTTKYGLGQLCPRGHNYHGTGQSLRHLRRHVCLACDAEAARERRRSKSQARP